MTPGERAPWVTAHSDGIAGDTGQGGVRSWAMTAPTAASIRRGALVPALTVDTLLFEFAIVHQVILAT